MYIDEKNWSNEPRQEKAVGTAIIAALFIFGIFIGVIGAAQFIGSLF